MVLFQSRRAPEAVGVKLPTFPPSDSEELKVSPSLFPEEHEGADVYEYATHFRRQLKARLLADAGLHPGIVNGLRKRIPSIEFEGAQGVIPDAMPDLRCCTRRPAKEEFLSRMTSRRCPGTSAGKSQRPPKCRNIPP